MSSREAAQQALEALEQCGLDDTRRNYALESAAITALRAALAEEALDRMSEDERRLGIQMQPVLEPVAWMLTENKKYGNAVVLRKHKPKTYDSDWWTVTPLYTTPPQMKPLTEEEISKILDDVLEGGSLEDVARAIEKAHGIGGSDD